MEENETYIDQSLVLAKQIKTSKVSHNPKGLTLWLKGSDPMVKKEVV